MPSLIDIRRRIRSVRNTQQITKAMKMVSAAKLRRAQDRVIAARPYALMLRTILANVVKAVEGSDEASTLELLAQRPEKNIQLLLITADRGLAGAFNSNLIRAAQRFAADHKDATVHFELMGRKGRDFFRKQGVKITGEHAALFQKVQRDDALAIARSVIERYSKGESDAVYLMVNTFKTVAAPELLAMRILPMETPKETGDTVDYIFEQPPAELLASLLPRYIEAQIFRAMLESSAAEHAARMTAMEAASSNAADVLERLTLNMNRIRQASITREIIEIVSGASALG